MRWHASSHSTCLAHSYVICRDVLVQLNETVPEIIDMRQVGAIVQDTVKTLMGMTDDALLGLKEMDRNHQTTLKFYTLLVCAIVGLIEPNAHCIVPVSNLFFHSTEYYCFLEEARDYASTRL